jgi:predicted nucleotidyltransferase
MGLLLVALDKPAYAELAQDLALSDPEHLAAIANQSYGQVILHSAFQKLPQLQSNIPHDLAIYFAEMQRANRDRNARAIAQMREMAEIWRPYGINAVALKGAADILSPLHPRPEHRYISDLDILVPRAQIQQAARLLRLAKGLSTDDHLLQPGHHHHLAQITHPDWLFTVELHVQPGSSTVTQVLDAADVCARAHPSQLEGILVPDHQDRLLHHILHGQELRHETASLNLRLLADHIQYLRILPDQTLKQALTRLKTGQMSPWLEDLTQLSRGLCGDIELPDHSWAARALRSFGNPQEARSHDNAFWLRHYARRFVQDRAYRRQALRKSLRPSAWAEFFAFHKDRRSKFK